jgi:hypothetical protein
MALTLPDGPALSPASRLGRGASRRASALGVCLLGLALFSLLPSGLAQTLRVTTWSLQPLAVRTNNPAANTNGIRIPAAAAALKRLNPDVILLQQVRDWAMCDELAQALKPAKYNVVACSAFRDGRSGELRKQQVAILAKAKAKAYFSWSEPWHNRGVPALPGGFAFAAFQVGKHRVGLFSIQVGAAPMGAAAKQRTAASPQERLAANIEQLLAQVGSVSSWVNNQVQGFVVGGTFGLPADQEMALHDTPLQLLQGAGFGDAFQDTPAADRATAHGRSGQPPPVADYIFTQPANWTANPRVSRAWVSRRFPVTCDVNLDAPPAVAAKPASTEPAAATASPPSSTLSSQANPQLKPVATTPAPPPTQSPEPQPQPAADAETAPALPQPSTLNPQLLLLVATGLVLLALAAIVWMLAARRRFGPPPSPALLTAGEAAPSGYTVVMGTTSATESALPGPRPAPAPAPLIHIEATGDTHTQTEALRQRALAAEERAERATALVRNGLVPHLRHWLKHTLVRKLITDRAQLLETQRTAARKAMAVEARLARIEQQVQQQNYAYQARIEELTRELLTAKEENRELIRERIAQIKAEMEAARARLIAQSQTDDSG